MGAAEESISESTPTQHRHLIVSVRRGADPRTDAYVAEHHAASLYHRAQWLGLIERLFGHRTYTVYAEREGRLAGVLPMVRLKSWLFGDYLVSLPYFNYGGALGDSQEIERMLIERAFRAAGELGVAHAELRHTARHQFCALERTDKVVMVRSLPAEDSLLWDEVGSKRRAQIRRPLKEGASVKVGGAELAKEFYRVYSRNMRDLGTPVYPFRFFSEILQNFSRTSSVILVRLSGKTVAAAILLGFRDKLEIPWASSLREANRYGVNMLLYWEAMKWAIAEGYTQFDFGRSSLNSGTFRFKKQWGAEPVQLYWNYWLRDGQALPGLTPDNPKYALAIRIWKRLPVPLTRLIGPSIVKNLP